MARKSNILENVLKQLGKSPSDLPDVDKTMTTKELTEFLENLPVMNSETLYPPVRVHNPGDKNEHVD